MKISIVTPTLNSVRFVRTTVESVLSQKGDFELEYIIRDGLSTDGTLDVLQEHSGKCRIISEKDSSPQAAINAGMAQATGDVLAWLNADDVYEPGALQRIAEKFRDRPGVTWAFGRCSIIDEKGREIRKPITWYKNIIGWRYSRNVLLCENFINQPATFFRRELWQKIGGLSLYYKAAYDYDLWLRMAELSPALPVHAPIARFRRHEGSISENFYSVQFTEEKTIARPYGNMVHHLLHAFNCVKTVMIYRFFSAQTGKHNA